MRYALAAARVVAAAKRPEWQPVLLRRHIFRALRAILEMPAATLWAPWTRQDVEEAENPGDAGSEIGVLHNNQGHQVPADAAEEGGRSRLAGSLIQTAPKGCGNEACRDARRQAECAAGSRAGVGAAGRATRSGRQTPGRLLCCLGATTSSIAGCEHEVGAAKLEALSNEIGIVGTVNKSNKGKDELLETRLLYLASLQQLRCFGRRALRHTQCGDQVSQTSSRSGGYGTARIL